MHNHDADSETCLNRQILNNYFKRKALEDLCERPRKLIHRELRSQYLYIVTYKDISRNMHNARSSQLPSPPTDIEETHEALNAVRVLKVRQNLHVNHSEKKTIVTFSI